MRAAGVRQIGETAGPIDLPEPRALRADEVLLDVRACGVLAVIVFSFFRWLSHRAGAAVVFEPGTGDGA